MWPVVFRVLRQYAPIVTLPFAAVIGYVGYHIEDFISDKYTPYNKAIEESRNERLISDESLSRATEVESLAYSANVFGKNIAPSLK